MRVWSTTAVRVWTLLMCYMLRVHVCACVRAGLSMGVLALERPSLLCVGMDKHLSLIHI